MSKKRKFKKISFKLSSRQINTINKFCKIQKTTKNKIIKKAIKEFVDKNLDILEKEKLDNISENQLQLFDFIEIVEEKKTEHLEVNKNQLQLFNLEKKEEINKKA